VPFQHPRAPLPKPPACTEHRAACLRQHHPNSPCESSGGLYRALASSTLPSMDTTSFLSTEETGKLSCQPHFCTGRAVRSSPAPESSGFVAARGRAPWQRKLQRRVSGKSRRSRGLREASPRLDLPGRTGSEEGKCWVLRDHPWKPHRPNLRQEPRGAGERPAQAGSEELGPQGYRFSFTGPWRGRVPRRGPATLLRRLPHSQSSVTAGGTAALTLHHSPLRMADAGTPGGSSAVLGNPSRPREASESPPQCQTGDESFQVSCGEGPLRGQAEALPALESPPPTGSTTQHPPHGVTALGRLRQH